MKRSPGSTSGRFQRGTPGNPGTVETLNKNVGQGDPADPRPRDASPGSRSPAGFGAILRCAVKQALADQVTDSAASLAYYAFLALPALLLLAVGLFSLLGTESAIATMTDKLGLVAPSETVRLVDRSLRQVIHNQSGGLALTVVGAVLALWTATGAMNALMRALNRIYGRKETRGFVRLRLTGLAMMTLALAAFLLVFGLLVLGPQLSGWVGSVVGWESGLAAIWWAAQWPILILGLLASFAAILYLGPNVDRPRWRLLSPGAVLAVAIWLAASGLFAVYVSMFGSYNKTWGSLAAVIIMLTWLWLSGVALLLGAEVNAALERRR
jgi:membrane protein